MNKILSILMLVVIGGALSVALVIAYILSMIYLLINEIIGTKKFAIKFHKLNKIIAEEFSDIIKVFRDLYMESK